MCFFSAGDGKGPYPIDTALGKPSSAPRVSIGKSSVATGKARDRLGTSFPTPGGRAETEGDLLTNKYDVSFSSPSWSRPAEG
jgi:hypothetical protein